jgi:hypothetical protein
MEELYTEIQINSSVHEIWDVLVDIGSYSLWNPFMRIQGMINTGELIDVKIQPSGAKGMSFRPKILKLVPQYELRWLGRLGVPGIFDGEHIFELKPIDSNHTLFVQREVFTGILVPFVSRSLDRDSKRGFMEMNVALKKRVEQALAPVTGGTGRKDAIKLVVT